MAVSVPSIDAYPSGLVLRVVVQARDAARPGVEAGEGTLRFGVGLPDGRKATSFGLGGFGAAFRPRDALVSSTTFAATGPPEPPEEPLLRALGGSGSRTIWTQWYWLWPLPAPGGELLLACEWPNVALELTTAAVSVDTLREAASRARELWPPGEVPLP